MNANERRHSGPAVLNRVLGYMLHYYKYLFVAVIGCILVSAVCTVVGATFPQTLIDDYIEPMLSSGSRDFSGLANDIKRLACIMGAGVIASFGYNRIMVLDNGRVNAFDTHENLLKSNPIYQEIYESQVKGGGDFDQPA